MHITTLLNLLFPPTEDEIAIASHTHATFQKLYTGNPVKDVVCLSSFHDKPIRAAVHLNKFHNHTHAQILLGSLLELFLNNRALQEHALLIPIPLSAKRQRERGHNQVLSVFTHTTFDTRRYTVETTVLKKVRDTKPQTTLKREERTKNPQGVYACTDRARTLVRGAHIILIDDVVTSGATLKAAKEALKACKPASITCVALAH